MKRLRQLWRIMHINFVMARYGLDQFILAAPVFYPIRFLIYLNPFYWLNRHSGKSRGECLRLALIALGPIFVKFGQILSTRRDLLPDDIAEELEQLQDKVPPFSGLKAKAIIEKAFGKTINDMFLEFDLTPLASASIAQVHAATLLQGQRVVVKVLRPNIESVIRNDISLLYILAGLVERYWSHGPRLRPKEIVAEFERAIIDELDLLREAANAAQLRRNFLNSPVLYVPDVYWQYAKNNVVVYERIHGIPVADIARLREKNINLKKLAEHGVEVFFTQVFRDSFFHADMHPGNIFVNPDRAEDPQYIAVDFGIMGSLSPNDQRYLAENLVAFFKRDYRRVAILHVESGWVPPDTRVEEFESTIRAVCEPIFGRPLKQISFGQLLLRLFQTARRFHMQVQPQLMLLQKTLLNIEGLGRQLYPELDLWQTGKPYIERWLKTQIGIKAILRTVKQQAPYWSERITEMPDLIYSTLMRQQKMAIQAAALTAAPPKPQRRTSAKILILIGVVLIIVTALHLVLGERLLQILYHHLDIDVLVLGILCLISGIFLKNKSLN